MRALTMVALLAAVACAGCKVKVKDSGELPKVDIKPGKMPDVEVSTDSLHLPNVKVPEVKAPDIHAPDVHLPEVKAPDVKLPDLDGKDDRPARTDTTRRP